MSISFFLTLMVVCCGYALLRGGTPERIAAGLQVGAYALTLAMRRIVDLTDFRAVSVGAASVDAALLVALFLLAWRSTRYWPLWITGWQTAVMVAHFAKLLDPAMRSSGYALQTQLWAYPMLIATAIGAWRHQARLAAGDPDPSWKALPA